MAIAIIFLETHPPLDVVEEVYSSIISDDDVLQDLDVPLFRDLPAVFGGFFRNLLHELFSLRIHASEIPGDGHLPAVLHPGCDLVGVQFVSPSADRAFYT